MSRRRRAARAESMPATSWASCSWARSRASASSPTIYWMSELYGNGSMDPYIRTRAGPRPADPRDLLPREPRREGARLAAAVGHLRELRQDRDHPRHRLERLHGRLRLQAGPRHVGDRLRSHGPRAADRRAGSSCPSTSTGPRSGACSASPSRGAARTSPRPAARATGAMPSLARSSSASRRSTCPTSSSTSAARR